MVAEAKPTTHHYTDAWEKKRPNLEGFWTEAAQTIWAERYLHKNEDGTQESIEDRLWSVAHSVGSAELNFKSDYAEAYREKFYEMMVSRRFLPNSPTLMNAGKNNGLNFSACFVLPIEDDLNGIFDTIRRTALIHKSGGGSGFSFGRLREKDATVRKTQGVSSGPVSFLRVFDAATEAIKQGGMRRGANMAVMPVDHPNILEFIDCKLDGGITNFNISVGMSKKFMDKVLTHDADDSFELISRVDGSVHSVISAKLLWTKLVDAAWASGDPGLVFLDVVNSSRANPNPNQYLIEATNPCLSGDTLIYTENGMQRMSDLYQSQVAFNATVDHPNIFASSTPVFKTGTKQLYKLTTKEGYSVRLTEDHKVMTQHGKVEAGKLRKGDLLRLLPHKGGFGNDGSRELGLLLGWLIADGTIVKDRAVLSFFGEKKELSESFAENMQMIVAGEEQTNRDYTTNVQDIKGRDEQRIGSVRFLRIAEEHGLDRKNKHHIPDSLWTGSEEMVRGFLQAMFTADGTVLSQAKNNTKGVRLTSVSYEMLQGVQQLLMNFGIASRIYKNRRQAGERMMPDGKGGSKLYKTQAYHELSISKDNLYRFADEVPFLLDSKQDKLVDALDVNGVAEEGFYVRFEELTPDGIEDVYDITVPLTSTLCSNGLVVSNCGEQALPPDDACNLGSLNLAKYVGGPIWTKDVDGIDWALLKQDVHLAVRFLDNVIETNPIDDPAVVAQVQRSRRIGLGVMGFADMLILLNIPYASKKARDLATELIQFIQDEAEYETIQLATERGTFPDWEQSIYYPDTPRRNSTLTMVAPTGSISILAGCSSGIEPLFELTYKHRSPAQPDRILTIASDAVVKFITRQKFMNTAHVLEHIEQNGTINNYTGAVEVSRFKPVAEVLATAMEIGWEDHVLMQAAWQTHCENGISKTINMVNSATRDEVEHAYILAYNKGCRGITVFRDGCKGYDFQVLRRVKEEAVETTEGLNIGNAAPVEPFIVSVPSHIHASRPGNTRTVAAPEGKVHVVMNEDKYGLVEVFMIIGKAGSDIQAFAESLGRMVSLQLRSCDPSVRSDTVAKIAHQLRGISGSGSVGFGPNQVRSLPDALGLVLEQHQNLPFEGWIEVVADAPETPKNVQTHSYSGALCPDCGSIKMVKAEGCTKCLNCGYSKC